MDIYLSVVYNIGRLVYLLYKVYGQNQSENLKKYGSVAGGAIGGFLIMYILRGLSFSV
mgnify:CR=1 FL=1